MKQHETVLCQSSPSPTGRVLAIMDGGPREFLRYRIVNLRDGRIVSQVSATRLTLAAALGRYLLYCELSSLAPGMPHITARESSPTAKLR
jgi:hypothetical protein